MDVYEFCRIQYNKLVKQTCEKVPVSKTDIISNKHVPYFGLPFFEMSFIAKKLDVPFILNKEIEEYISLWEKFANPEDKIMPVDQRYEIYINDVSKLTKDMTEKIIFQCIYMKFNHEDFNAPEQDARKRKAFGISMNSMVMNKKIKTLKESPGRNSLDTLLSAAEIISLEEDIKMKAKELSMDGEHTTEQAEYITEANSAIGFVVMKQKSVRNALIAYINGPHIEIIKKHEAQHQKMINDSVENIKKYQKILVTLTSLIEENENNESLKMFITNIKSDVTHIQTKIEEEESIKQKKISMTDKCNLWKPFFDKMMRDMCNN